MPLFESAIGGIAWSIVETAGKAGKYVFEQGKEAYNDTQRKQAVIQAFAAYEQHYRNRHCQIKIMPGLMKAPMELNSIYTDVKLLDDNNIRCFADVQELEEGFRAKGRRGFGDSDAERVSGIEVANHERFLMVLGGPGIGKSTFLRKIGLEVLEQSGNIQRECIPVFLELKKFRDESLDIKQEIIKELDACQFPPIGTWVESALEQGKLLILFDGLDEVPTKNLRVVVEQIEDFISKYDNNSFVVSCRTAAYRHRFNRFVDVTIADLGQKQIERFIHTWFSSQKSQPSTIAKNLLKLLEGKEHESTREFVQNPLLLTYICIVFKRDDKLPKERYRLYDRLFYILLKEWYEKKELVKEYTYEELNPDVIEDLLSKLAYESLEKDQLFFSERSIIRQISIFISSQTVNLNQLRARTVLKEIEEKQGLLVKQLEDTYSFAHLTIQEYLTALYIEKNERETTVVENHLTDERWREVFLLTSGLMDDRALQLLMDIEAQAKTYIEPYEKVKDLVRWAAVNKRGESMLEHKSGMIGIASALARASTIARASTNTKAIAINDASALAITKNIGIRAKAIVIASDSATKSASALAIATLAIKSNASVLASANTIALASANTSASAFDKTSGIHHFLNGQHMSMIADKLSTHGQRLPQADDSSDKWSGWAEQLLTIWLEALELNKDSITFSVEEANALESYLYAIELLIRCKESAMRVSRGEWATLEKRLLTI